MKKKRVLMLLGSVCLALVLVVPLVAACAGPTPSPTPTPKPTPTPTPTPAPPEKVKFVMASYHPLTHPNTIAEQKFADELKERSNGRIVCDYYGAETLVKSHEIFDAVSAGRIQMGETYASYMEGVIPLLGMVVLPGAITSKAGTESIMEHGGLDIYQREYDKYGLVVLHFTWLGSFYFYTNVRPVLSPEDLKGMKIKVAGKKPGDFIELLGGSPVMLSGPETYMALQRGTIDGTIWLPYCIPSYKTYEVLKYGVNNVTVGSGWNIVFTNKEWLEGLPDDVRSLILDTSAEFNYRYANDLLEQWNDDAWGIMKEKGDMEISAASPENVNRFADLGAPLVEESLKEWGAPGRELYEICKEHNK